MINFNASKHAQKVIECPTGWIIYGLTVSARSANNFKRRDAIRTAIAYGREHQQALKRVYIESRADYTMTDKQLFFAAMDGHFLQNIGTMREAINIEHMRNQTYLTIANSYNPRHIAPLQSARIIACKAILSTIRAIARYEDIPESVVNLAIIEEWFIENMGNYDGFERDIVDYVEYIKGARNHE